MAELTEDNGVLASAGDSALSISASATLGSTSGSASQESTTSYKRSEKYWFSDGTIVIQLAGTPDADAGADAGTAGTGSGTPNAASSTRTTMYRVHQSVLSSQSVFFRDLFSVPQPSGEPTIEGCPVVQLHDTQEDIDNLMALLYDTLAVLNRRDDGPSLSTVGTMLHLGRKYQFKHLRKEAIAFLQNRYPNAFWEFHRLTLNVNVWDEMLANLYTGEIFDTVILAHKNSVKSILPVLYVVITTTFQTDHIQEYFTAALERYRKRSGTSESPMRFEEPASCIKGKAQLKEALPSTTLQWLFNNQIPSAACQTTEACKESVIHILRNCLLLDTRMLAFAFDPRWALNDERDFGSLCEVCLKEAETKYLIKQPELWATLPEIFTFGKDEIVWDTEDGDDDGLDDST